MREKMIKGTFTSVWSGRAVTTSCQLDPNSGELFPKTVDTYNDLGNLEREYFEDEDGDEHEVCSTCHEFILKGVMNPDIGHDLNEEMECSNPDCESHEE